MTINEHVTHFAGLPVIEFEPSDEISADPAQVAWRLSTDIDAGQEAFDQKLDALLAAPWAGEIRALVVGDWGDCYENTFPIDRFVAVAPSLPGLTAIFVGEMTYEESEISWIQSTDITPLLTAYPRLDTVRMRGGEGLAIAPGQYPRLRELAFEAGGLSAEVVNAVGACEFARLEHLELWLGTANYGGNSTVEDLAPILSGARLPALTYLGLRDSEIVDLIAAALAGAPVVSRLATLDLSLGMLSDEGAAALLSGQPLTHLRRLDLRHHFLSPDMQIRLRDELGSAGVDVDLSDGQSADRRGGRFIAVAE